MPPTSHYDTVPLTATFSSVGTTIVTRSVVSQIAQGTVLYQRQGRVIRVIELSLSGTLVGGQSNTAADEARNTVRLGVLLMAPGVPPTAITVSTVLGMTVVPGLLGVITDRVYALRAPARDTVGYLPAIKRVNVRVPMNLQLVYTSDAAIAPYPDIYIFMVSDSALVPSPGFVDGSWIVRFVTKP